MTQSDLTEDFPESPSIAVIGAGLAGLAAARRLSEAGVRVVVFDKGRGHGGRCATRRRQAGTFNHGASAVFPRPGREEAFRRLREADGAAAVLAPWRPSIGRLGEPDPILGLARAVETVYVAKPGMSDLARALAGEVERQFSRRVRSIEVDDAGVRLRFESGEVEGPFDRLLVTAPPPQAAQLLGAVPELAEPLRAITMTPAFSLLLAFPESVTELDWIEGRSESALLRAVRQSGESGDGPGAPEAFVVQSGAAWSRSRFETTRAELVPAMLALLKEALDALGAGPSGELPRPSFAEVHRWAYAFPEEADSRRVLSSKDGRCLYASGALNGGDLAGAHEAGLAAAEAIVADLACRDPSGRRRRS